MNMKVLILLVAWSWYIEKDEYFLAQSVWQMTNEHQWKLTMFKVVTL